MTILEMFYRFLTVVAVIANICFIPLSVLLGLLYMAADIEAPVAISGLTWGLVMAVSSGIVIAGLIRRKRGSLRDVAYGATLFILAGAGWEWLDHLPRTSDLLPPAESIVHGGLGLLNLASLAVSGQQCLPRTPS